MSLLTPVLMCLMLSMLFCYFHLNLIKFCYTLTNDCYLFADFCVDKYSRWKIRSNNRPWRREAPVRIKFLFFPSCSGISVRPILLWNFCSSHLALEFLLGPSCSGISVLPILLSNFCSSRFVVEKSKNGKNKCLIFSVSF